MGTALQDMIPELILGMAAAACFFLGAFPPVRRAARLTAWFALIFAGAAAAVQTGWWQGGAAAEPWYAAFNGLFRLLAPGLGMVLLASMRADAAEGHEAESAACLLSAVLGVMLVGGAGDLITLFLGLELISVASYILLYLDRDGALPQESAGKYFYLSILSSAVLLYGLSYVYGLGGSLRLDRLVYAWAGAAGMPGDSALGAFAIVLVFTGLAFKIAAVPFHFYAPDVYQGTSHANASLLSVLPKAAGMAAVIKLLLATMVGWGGPVWQAVLAVAVLTMTVGNVIALWQTHLRRLLAYSSIAHAGYILIGLLAANQLGTIGVLYYLLAYTLMNLGAFGVVILVGRKKDRFLNIYDYSGLGFQYPGLAALMSVFMFALVGMPPTAGFVGKFYIFSAAVQAGYIWLVIIAVINSLISVYYYLRITVLMYMRPVEAEAGPIEMTSTMTATLVVSALGVILIGIFPNYVYDLAQSSAKMLGL